VLLWEYNVITVPINHIKVYKPFSIGGWVWERLACRGWRGASALIWQRIVSGVLICHFGNF